MVIPSLFQFLFAVTTVLAIMVLLRRLGRLEAQLAEAQREPQTEPAPPRDDVMRDMLISPLTVILAQCELARGNKEMDSRLEVIERHAKRIDVLLGRTRTKVPAVPAEVREMDPVACVRAAVDMHAGLALERGVKIHLVAEEAPEVRTNPLLLAHALRHLVHAAIDAAPSGVGDVTVAVGEIDDEVLFAVADDGPGLSADQLAVIFDTASSDGAGELGYSIVYAVSRALGATFVLDTAPEAGTRATLKLPVYKRAPQAPTKAEAPTLVPASL
jgi:signal transduction histidine kinase